MNTGPDLSPTGRVFIRKFKINVILVKMKIVLEMIIEVYLKILRGKYVTELLYLASFNLVLKMFLSKIGTLKVAHITMIESVESLLNLYWIFIYILLYINIANFIPLHRVKWRHGNSLLYCIEKHFLPGFREILLKSSLQFINKKYYIILLHYLHINFENFTSCINLKQLSNIGLHFITGRG